MGVAINVVACLLLMAFSPTFAEIDCEKSVHVNCPRDISLYATYSGSGVSEQFLKEHCSDILEDWFCKDDYLRTCLPDPYQLYSSLINGVTNMLTHLCNETSDLRRGFRENADCIQRKSDKFMTCVFMAMESAQRYTSHYGFGLYDSGLQRIARLCRVQGSFRSCTVRVAKHYCGKGAGQYMSSLYEITIQDMVSELC